MNPAFTPTVKTHQSGFSLVEVLTALAIVSISLLVLVHSNATAMQAMNIARKTSQATLMTQDIMNRALAIAEIYGFGENDINDRGNFEQPFPGEYPGWTWEWTLAKTHFRIPDMSGLMDQAGVDDQAQKAATEGGLPEGIDPSIFEELIGNYIREVRVTVCYPTGKVTKDCIEMVSHVVNPGGSVMPGEQQQIVLDRMGGGNLPDIFEDEQ